MERYQENSRRTRRVRDAQTVIGFLASQPELDGQVYQPAPHDVPDDHAGFDADGNWHFVVVERPDAAQSPQMNRWTDQGEYLERT